MIADAGGIKDVIKLQSFCASQQTTSCLFLSAPNQRARPTRTKSFKHMNLNLRLDRAGVAEVCAPGVKHSASAPIRDIGYCLRFIRKTAGQWRLAGSRGRAEDDGGIELNPAVIRTDGMSSRANAQQKWK